MAPVTSTILPALAQLASVIGTDPTAAPAQIVLRACAAATAPPAPADMPASLSPPQRELLASLNTEFTDEYSGRAAVLLTRLDATIASFCWSGRGLERTDEIRAAVAAPRAALHARIAHAPSEAFVVRPGMAAAALAVRRPTGGSALMATVIGAAVPDRGGRPRDAPCVPVHCGSASWVGLTCGGGDASGSGGGTAMPEFKPRTDGTEGAAAAAPGGHSGGRRGGRVQGGWQRR
jgi:hypothetical protein